MNMVAWRKRHISEYTHTGSTHLKPTEFVGYLLNITLDLGKAKSKDTASVILTPFGTQAALYGERSQRHASVAPFRRGAVLVKQTNSQQLIIPLLVDHLRPWRVVYIEPNVKWPVHFRATSTGMGNSWWRRLRKERGLRC
jgi:hypothetical protein